MSEQAPPNNNRPKTGNSNRRRHNNRRRPPNNNKPGTAPRPNENGQNPRPQQQVQRPDNRISLAERIYEKYQNLLDQHINARRKYHDLFYRADPAQKNKLERHFHSSLKDIRDFEARLNPVERELFEKRHNGLRFDQTYSLLQATNENASAQVDTIPTEEADPHYLQSQKKASYKEDREESVGTRDDYEKYKLTIKY